MTQISIIVRATWDDEAKVWVATSTDVEGLATEAETLELLGPKVLRMIGELLELNGSPTSADFAEIPVAIMAEQCARVKNPAFAA